jgi:hypothetical protein
VCRVRDVELLKDAVQDGKADPMPDRDATDLEVEQIVFDLEIEQELAGLGD